MKVILIDLILIWLFYIDLCYVLLKIIDAFELLKDQIQLFLLRRISDKEFSGVIELTLGSVSISKLLKRWCN